jgi:hypothetical protein
MPLLVKVNNRGRAALVTSRRELYHDRRMGLEFQVVFIVDESVKRWKFLVKTAPRKCEESA